MDPKSAFGTVRNAMQQNDSHLTQVYDILLEEPDLDKEHTDLQSPFAAIYPLDVIRSSPHDTERVGYTTDSDGNRTGKRFRATFDVPLQIDIYVAAGDADNDATNLGWELTQLLRPHDHRNESEPLPDSDGNPVSDVTHFLAGDGERADDLNAAPGIRRWRHEAMMTFFDEVETTEDVIKTVHTPRDGDFGAGSGNVAIEYDYQP